jgi:dTDP-4-amino-4,6-dideoxygalactose transaminase
MSGDIALADFKQMWDLSRDRYLEALDRVGRSGWVILGKEVSQFETELAGWWGHPWAVGVANGLDALEIAFRCEGMKRGDLVLTTPLSAFATTLAILRVGAIPVFADVDPSGLLDLADAETVVSRLSVKPRFVVPVHLYGHALSLRSLEAFAARHGMITIEDCAQAIGARSDGRPVGSAGRVCATSFYPTKNLGAFGDAGALLTSSVEVRDLARTLRDYGQSDKYVHDEVGLNSRLDEVHAAMLRSVQLPLLAAQTARRKQIASRYIENITCRALEIPPVPSGSDSVWHLFPVIVDGDRDRFREHLEQRKVGTALHYPHLIPNQKAMRDVPVPKVGPLPRATRFAQHQVSLPLHPFLTDEQVNQVISACNGYSA